MREILENIPEPWLSRDPFHSLRCEMRERERERGLGFAWEGNTGAVNGDW